MGFQIFPEPISASEDNTTYGFFNQTNASQRRAPDITSIDGVSTWISNIDAPSGFYQSQPTSTHTSGWAVFNGVQLTPSNTTGTIVRVATSGTDVRLSVRTLWQSATIGAMASVSTANLASWKVHNANTSPVFIAGIRPQQGINPQPNPFAISTNGFSWTQNRLGFATDNAQQGRGSFFKNGEYFAITNSAIHSSTDLVNWTTKAVVSFGAPLDALYDSVTNRFYVVSSSLEPTYRTSTDAVNWTTGTWGAVTNGTRFYIKRVNDFLYAYGSGNNNWINNPTLQVSTNGINWQIANYTTSLATWGTQLDPTFRDVEYGNGFYFAIVSSGDTISPTNQRDTILTSTDGLNFNVTYGPTTGSGFASAMWDPENQQAIVLGWLGTSGSIVVSTNGTNWTARNSPNALTNISPIGSDNNVAFYANFSEYVPGATANKYYIVGTNTRNNLNEVAPLNGRVRYSPTVGGNSSGSFEMLVNKYNLSIDNTQ